MPLNPGRNLKLRQLKAFSEATQALYRPGTPTEYQRQVVNSIESFFGSDIVVYNEFRPKLGPLVVDNANLQANRPVMDAFARYMKQNPLIAQLLRQQRLPGSRLTDALPMTEFKKTDVYNEVYHPIGGDFQVGCGFIGCDIEAHVAVAMNQKLRDFTDEELYLFQLFVPHLEQSYHLCHALETARGGRWQVEAALDGHSKGLLVFDDSFRVVTLAGVALRLAWVLFRARPQEGCLMPDDLLRCVRQLQGGAREGRPNAVEPLVYSLEDGGSVTLRLARDAEHVNHVLLFEWKRGLPSLNRLRALGLNPEETEVIHGVLHRRPLAAIAATRAMSIDDVEGHLANVLKRLEVAEPSAIPRKLEELLPW